MSNLDWMALGACIDEDPELFFPTHRNDSAKDAKKVCRNCPVKRECGQYAHDIGAEFGVWGEATESERKAAALAIKFPLRPNQPTTDPRGRCGTYPGAKAHRQRLEQFCDACRAAKNDYENDRRRRLTAARREEAAS